MILTLACNPTPPWSLSCLRTTIEAELLNIIIGLWLCYYTYLMTLDIGGTIQLLSLIPLSLCFAYPGDQLGEWVYPNGTVIPPLSQGNSVLLSRNDRMEIFLRRQFDAPSSAQGTYCCRLPTASSPDSDETICVFLSKLCNYVFVITCEHLPLMSRTSTSISMV